MARSDRTREELARLQHLRSDATREEAIAELRRAMEGRMSLVTAGAAEIAAERDLRELIPALVAAFARLTDDGARADRQCIGKKSIVKALNALDYAGDDVYAAGSRYVQMEPVFGGYEDTAAEVRIGCAFGLARTEHPETLYILTDLLVDRESGVRGAAARALAYMGRPESVVLLRLKALTEDPEPSVTGDCFSGLMTMAPEGSLGFVARYLSSGDGAVAQYAALSLGNSRLSGAYDALRDAWDNDPSPTRRLALLLPIALIRSDESFAFLLGVIRDSSPTMAVEAIRALTIYRSEEQVARIQEAVDSRDDDPLRKVFTAEFAR